MPTWIMPTGAAVIPGAALLLSAALLVSAPPALADEGPSPFTITDQRITESSGLQASQRHPGVYWTHNDSDDLAQIYAVDGETGETVATVGLQGVEARDIEGISLGPDGDLYVGDIGDNFDGEWAEVWIYRIPEPAELVDTSVTPTVYPVQYEDGPRDAEAVMVHPQTGRVYIASKKRDRDAAIYAGPAELSPGETNLFERLADIDLWVTDGAFSPDGTRLLLREYFGARMYGWTEDGPPEPIDRRVLPPAQPQGESVTFTPEGRHLMFGSEGEGSEVEPVELSEELLPESVAAEESERPDDGESDEPPAEREEEDSDDSGISANGVTVLLVLAAIALLAGRRLPKRDREK